MSRSIKPIKAVRDYFKTDEIPIIVQEYWPHRGWIRGASKKRVSAAWLRKLKASGVQHVALSLNNDHRVADFSVAELLRSAKS